MYTHQGDTVFDMASGKGGDLNKWSSRRVRHVTFADVAVNQFSSLENVMKK